MFKITKCPNGDVVCEASDPDTAVAMYHELMGTPSKVAAPSVSPTTVKLRTVPKHKKRKSRSCCKMWTVGEDNRLWDLVRKTTDSWTKIQRVWTKQVHVSRFRSRHALDLRYSHLLREYNAGQFKPRSK